MTCPMKFKLDFLSKRKFNLSLFVYFIFDAIINLYMVI